MQVMEIMFFISGIGRGIITEVFLMAKRKQSSGGYF